MIATAEISLYPLHENYEEVIIEYILKLRQYEGLRVETNGMSTQVFGEYDTLMAALTAESKAVFESGKAVFELSTQHHHDHLVCLSCGKVIFPNK